MRLPFNKNSLRKQTGISGIVLIVIIIIALVVIGVGWQAQRAIAYKASENNYKEAKKLLLAKKPKEAYIKLLDAKDYALKKEGPAYYARLAGVALTNGNKQAAKQHLQDGLAALKGYSKKDKSKIAQQLKAVQKALKDGQPSPSEKPKPLDFKSLKQHPVE